MSIESHYGSLCAEYYDLTKPIARPYPDIAYYCKQLSKIDSEIGSRILEVAVGTGRLLVPLLEAGLNVEGLDNSPEMLDYCRKNCQNRGLNPVLHQGDMVNFQLTGKFKAIVVAWGSFMLVETRSRAISALETFAKHLESGGQLFIDLEIPIEDFKTNGQIQQLPPVNCPDDSIILLQKTSQVDPIAQLNLIMLRYEKWKNGQLIQTELQRFPLHWFGVDEFVMLLQKMGYRKIQVCANYREDQKPSHYNDELCFKAEI
ncbi:class I SAM-dependent methyltransferase [Oxynema aestuarii]|uniref:Class I SAM-dependent methyltransferase n=1 Tax=Oxynema aestuarii AP17 TaxID=2064643 RepID=A0A6H1TXX4_9CYAN|nr:class I SAM-dependent methyltransferase [Oxynema aestuarii]QIZ71066.1 class I SAM-dependent methyltransferase [Oxynema aestuarii AP17]